MGTLPKPLIGLLLGTVAFFAIWMVALKPHSSSSGGSQGGVGQYQPAINQAHQAVTTSNQANAKLGAPTATAPAPKPATPAKPAAPVTKAAPATTAKAAPATTAKTAPATTAKAAPASKPTAQSESAAAKTAAQTVGAAIRDGKVVAILFYNDAAADDRAVKTELAAIPTHRGQVVKVAVPVSQLIQFSSLAQTVDVNTAPELVLIDKTRQASTLVGYADSVEIAQRINDALATK
jgi:nucleoid-associated protein YgaU